MALLYVLFGFQLCLLLIFVFYRLAIVIKVEKMVANTKVYRNSLNTLYMHPSYFFSLFPSDLAFPPSPYYVFSFLYLYTVISAVCQIYIPTRPFSTLSSLASGRQGKQLVRFTNAFAIPQNMPECNSIRTFQWIHYAYIWGFFWRIPYRLSPYVKVASSMEQNPLGFVR